MSISKLELYQATKQTADIPLERNQSPEVQCAIRNARAALSSIGAIACMGYEEMLDQLSNDARR
jgi:hypothetical protein